jgi:hypothetical protein
LTVSEPELGLLATDSWVLGFLTRCEHREKETFVKSTTFARPEPPSQTFICGNEAGSVAIILVLASKSLQKDIGKVVKWNLIFVGLEYSQNICNINKKR